MLFSKNKNSHFQVRAVYSLIWRDLLCLTLFLGLLFTAFLSTRPLMTPDEGRYTEIPREMVESGDYLTPRLNYIKYFEKPPFFYWIETIPIKLFGLHTWALRLMVAITAWLGCCVVYLAGFKLLRRRVGILASLILATSLLYFNISRILITDMPLTLWMTSCLLLFLMGNQEKKNNRKCYYFWGMYASAGLAVLTKGLIGALLPGLVIFIWWAVTHSWHDIKTYCIPSGLLLFLAITAPWHIWIQLQNPEFFHFYFIEQHFLRYLTDYAGRQQGLWFIPVVTLLGFFPWICFGAAFLIQAVFPLSNIREKIKNRVQNQNYSLFFIIWSAVLFIFFTFSQSQLIPYALPIMPPLALLVANGLSQEWDNPSSTSIHRGFSLVAFCGVLISLILGIFFYLHAADRWAELVLFGILTLLTTTLGSLFIYQRFGVYFGFISLILGISIFFVIGDVTYGKVANRSIEPLAKIVETKQTLNTPIATYHEYYQDLPVYLKKRVWVVGYTGELLFGIQHQDTRDWVMDEKTFWYRWHQAARVFMITPLNEYQILEKENIKPLYILSKTHRDILLSNQP